MADDLLQHPNVRNFLDFIADSEGGTYDTIVGGKLKASSFDAHPNIVGLRTKEGPSTAAGRYQIVKSTWDPYAKRLGITDFSPQSQDRIALEIIKDHGALDHVLSGDYKSAIGRLGSQWASLPSSPYSQPKRTDAWVAQRLNQPMAKNDEWEVVTSRPIGQAAPADDEWAVTATRPVPSQSEQKAPRVVPNVPEKKKMTWSEYLEKGKTNLQNEMNMTGVKNLGLGVIKGLSDVVDGGAQLAARGAAAASGYIAPGSTVDKFFQDELKKTETYNQDREDRYQAATKDSVLAGAGRVGGNIVAPAGGANRVVQAASLPQKMVAGASLGARTAALQPVYNTDTEGFAGQKTGQVLGGAALGAGAPVVSRVFREGAAALGSNAAKQSLINERMRYLFGNNPNAASDAAIITQLAKVREGKGTKLQATDLNAVENKMVNRAEQSIKDANLIDDRALADAIKNYKGYTPAEFAALKGTPEGEALAKVLTEAQRVNQLTQTKFADGGLKKLIRGAIDSGLLEPIPMPTQARNAIKNVLGGTQYRHQVAENLLGDRNVAAAEKFIKQSGELSPGQQGLGVLSQAADDRLAADMAVGREQAVAKRAAAEESALAKAQAEAEKAAKAEEKRMIQEGSQIIAERKAAEKAALEGKAAQTSPIDEANKAISELQSKDPTYLLGLSNKFGAPRNEKEMAEFSKQMRLQMESRVVKESTESVQKAESAVDKALNGDFAGLSTNTPQFQAAFKAHQAASPELTEEAFRNALFEAARENPELKKGLSAMFSAGGFPKSLKKSFYEAQNAAANRLGIKMDFSARTPIKEAMGAGAETPIGKAMSGPRNDVSAAVYKLSDADLKAYLGRDTDTLGASIGNQRGYLTTRLSRALEQYNAGTPISEVDANILLKMGFIK